MAVRHKNQIKYIIEKQTNFIFVVLKMINSNFVI